MKTKKLSLAIGGNFSVDAEAGTLRDLALITADREASGHGIYIDAKTLDGGLDSIRAKGGLLKAYITHGSLKDFFEAGGDRVMQVPGYFSDIKIKGNQLVAGSFEFYETFREEFPREYRQLIEMAEKTPDLFGLSIEAYGYTVFIDADGNEFSKMPEEDEDDNREWQHNGLPVLRITNLAAASFVSEPAANDGLFARLSRMFSSSPDLGRILTAFAKFAESDAHFSAPVNPAPPYKDPDHRPKSPPKIAMNKIIEQINAKFGSDQTKFSAAMTLLGKEPTITFDGLERRMIEADLQAANKQIAELSAAVEALTEERDKLSKEKESLSKSLASGYAGIDLGLPASGESGFENPFDPKTRNFTKQKELLEADPELAKKLQSAAKKTA